MDDWARKKFVTAIDNILTFTVMLFLYILANGNAVHFERPKLASMQSEMGTHLVFLCVYGYLFASLKRKASNFLKLQMVAKMLESFPLLIEPSPWNGINLLHPSLSPFNSCNND